MPVITFMEALRQALRDAMNADPRVFIIGEDVVHYDSAYGVTKGFVKEFGEHRVRDMPIAEAGYAGLGIGSAMNGLVPVVEMMTTNFALLALDMIVNHAAKLHYMFGGQFTCPIVFRLPNGYGQLSATHSQAFENYYAYMPGLKVVAPGTAYDAKGLMKAAIEDPDPVIFIEHTGIYSIKGEVPEESYSVPIGKSNLLRDGNDVTIVTYGRMTGFCQTAAEKLAQEGIDAAIVDLRTLRPLDMEPVLESFRKTGRAVIASEEWTSVGVGSEVATRLYTEGFDHLDAPIWRVGFDEVPMPYAKNLEASVVPSPDSVVEAVKNVMAGKTQKIRQQ
ncbi:MAG: alpha-ketoacid dehydrogenase subunit beta [Herpetosiphon sp.]|nr:alpha-ketoacid dehydrogenase subunit beta [Herpetosiphon sp.]